MHGPNEGEDVLPSPAHLPERNYATTRRFWRRSCPRPSVGASATLALIGAGVGGSSSTQAGKEATVCNVINRRKYCADMVKALEDLVLDKIGDKYSFGRIRQTTSTQFLSSLKTLKLDGYSRL
jgi:hypothetical protein